MRKSQTWFMILSILAGGFFLASFFLDQPLARTAGAEILQWAERLFATLLFFAVADAAILQIRKTGGDGGMRIIRILGFAAFVAVLMLGLVKGPEDSELNSIVYAIQNTMESALAGLVCLSLIYAMYRLPSQAPSALKSAFFAGLLVFLFIYSGLAKMLPLPEIVVRLLDWVQSIPRGALTGLLMGIALGGAVTGIRFILSGKTSAKEDK